MSPSERQPGPVKALFPLLLWLAFPATYARAVYVIPYDLRLSVPGTAGPAALDPEERYSVLVVLGDTYRQPWGQPDALQTLLAENPHPDVGRFLRRYLEKPHGWYVDQMARRPRIYGPADGPILNMVRQALPVLDGQSSFVVLTRYRRWDRPVATLQASTPNGEGLLPDEYHFLHRGLEGRRLPRDPVAPAWTRVPVFQADPAHPDFFPIGFPMPERLLRWPRGGSLMLKHFGMDPEAGRKFLPYLYFIARAHGMLLWGRDEDRQVVVSRLWLGCVGDTFARYYEKTWGFERGPGIQNEHTAGKQFIFMSAAPETMDRRIQEHIANALPEAMSFRRKWLVYDRKTAAALNVAGCARQLVRLRQPPRGLRQ